MILKLLRKVWLEFLLNSNESRPKTITYGFFSERALNNNIHFDLVVNSHRSTGKYYVAKVSSIEHYIKIVVCVIELNTLGIFYKSLSISILAYV